MRCVIILFLFSCVFCKNSARTLTESQGQEVIEIGAPLKDLPSDLEEEPSAENDERDVSSTTLVTTKKQPKKTATAEIRRSEKRKDIDKIDGVAMDDEEARIEKELAEIYKDNIEDYKADSSEKELTANVSKLKGEVTDVNKPVGRSRNSFKFEPNMKNAAAIEKFRTSVDEISCKRKLAIDKSTTPVPGSAYPVCTNIAFLIVPILTYFISTVLN